MRKIFKKPHAERGLCFAWGFMHDLRLMFWLCLGRIVCVCVHTQIRGTHYVAAQRPCPATVLACTRKWILQLLHHSQLSQIYPADSRLPNVLLLFWFQGWGLALSSLGLKRDKQQMQITQRMQEIKDIYVFLRIWMMGEELLIWLWTSVIYLEPWSKAPVHWSQ